MRNLGALCFAGMALLPAARAFEFTKIVQVGDPIPMSDEDFDFMTYPVFSNGMVAFNGSGTAENSPVQTYGGMPGGSLALLFGTSTPIPDGTGTFESQNLPVFWNGNYAFLGTGSAGQAGIYTGLPGSLARVADRSTLMPDGGGATFDEFNPDNSRLGINTAGDVAFVGVSSGGLTGIYRSSSGTLSKVVDTTDVVPGSSDHFKYLENPTLTATSTVFFGTAVPEGGPIGGIYERDFAGGAISPVATLGGMDPLGNTFNGFSGPLAGGSRIAFVGLYGTGGSGLYYMEDDTLHTLFTAGMTIPGTSIIAEQVLANFSLNETGDILFTLNDAFDSRYIVAWYDGQFSLVADPSTLIDGKTPLPEVPSLGVSAYQFSGNTAALYVVTGPGEFGIYTVTLPEPATWTMLGLGLAVMAFRLRKRQ